MYSDGVLLDVGTSRSWIDIVARTTKQNAVPLGHVQRRRRTSGTNSVVAG